MKFGIATMALVGGIAGAGGYWAGQQDIGRSQLCDLIQAANHNSTPMEVAQKERKLLYYRNPMGLPDTSPTPKKDPMGMDYIPVYEGEQVDEPSGGNHQIVLSTAKIQKLGVRTESATLRTLDQVVRAAGRIEADERRVYTITPKFEGYVERLHVNATGQPVNKGQPLFEAYSQELVSAQREYAIAAQGVESLKSAGPEAQMGMRQLAESSLTRLRNWDISDEQLKALAKSGDVKRTLTFRSPVNGVVTEKKAQQGMRFQPGENLYQVADLSMVWVIADLYEQDIALVKTGAQARVKINAYPDKTFTGIIAYIYPTLKAETRTIPVRLELANPGTLLKPGMFAQVELPTNHRDAVVTVPSSAVIDSGTRQIILIQTREGRYEPRQVKLGARSDDRIEVLEGVREGEQLVVSANFLIDAESNLQAAVGGFGGTESETVKADRKGVGHKAEGMIEDIDPQTGVVTITHGPVESLKWPPMTMEFIPANITLSKGLKPGTRIHFEFVERGQGEWVMTHVTPASAGH